MTNKYPFTERLRVLFITAWYPTKEQPVGGVFVREHAKAAQLYNDVTVLHCAGRDPDMKELWRMEQEMDEELTGGIPTYRVWERCLPISHLSYLGRLWSVFQAFRRITDRGFYPHIIHANIYTVGLAAVLIGRLYDLPVVIMEHSSEFPQKLVPRLHLWGARLAFKWANVVIPVSKSLQQGIQEYGIKARFSVIPNVVDTHLFYPDLSIHLRPQSKRILFVGLLDSSHKKGVPYLLNALIRLHKQRDEWYLEIVGDGPTRREYEQLAASLGILDRITFHGLKSREEVSKYMRQCDFVVLPSSYETFGVVLIEALASGKPVIATNCGGPVEIVAKEVGWVVPPQDVTALARAIDYMLDHCSDYAPEHLTEYVRQRFSYEAVGQALSRIYHDVLV